MDGNGNYLYHSGQAPAETLITANVATVAFVSDHDERIREQAREWMAREHPGRGGLARASKVMGITRVMLGEYLKGHRGAGGEKTASAIAKVLGITTDEVFGLPRKRVVLGAPDPDAVHPVLGSRPGANEALARAKRQEPWFPAFAWDDALSTATLIAPAVVTPAMLIAVRAGALTPETLSLRQRFAPHWLLEWRCEVIARAFNSFEVA